MRRRKTKIWKDAMKKTIRMSLWAGGLLLLVGCATPARRIEANMDLFNTFPPEAQELIRAGRIDIGFTQPMVKMALGRPDRLFQRKTEKGQSEVWIYTQRLSRPISSFVDTGYYVRGRNGRRYWNPSGTWVDHDEIYEVERLRVEFDGDRVSAIEQRTPAGRLEPGGL